MASKSFTVQLRRSLAVGLDADDDNRVQRTDTTFNEICTEATVWPCEYYKAHQTQSIGNKETPISNRVLEGELFVPVRTKPSFIFPNISLRVRYLLSITLNNKFTPHSTTSILAYLKLQDYLSQGIYMINLSLHRKSRLSLIHRRGGSALHEHPLLMHWVKALNTILRLARSQLRTNGSYITQS
jgi:hypothetical protein